MKPHLVILGAPGSGKGTQATRLTKIGFKHISTGDLLRNEIAKKSDLGQRVSGILASGDLVDDATVLSLLRANCELDKVSYIFDGFPRNIAQVKILENELLVGRKTLAIYFKIDLSVLSERVVNRRTCSSCGEIYNLTYKKPKKDGYCDKCGSLSLMQRKDDTLETVSNRLKIFKETIEPMLAFYSANNILVEIDASLSEDEIYKKLEEIIG